MLLLLLACRTPDSPPSDPETVPWSGELGPLRYDITTARDLVPLRTVIHLHSPWSHDACDGAGYKNGVFDEACLADLRDGLCRAGFDLAFATDHPDYADGQPFEDLLLHRDGDTLVEGETGPIANRIACSGTQQDEVLWFPGTEDQLMPVGLERHVSEDAKEAHAIYNAADAAAVEALQDAGALVLMAHTEGKELADLEALQDLGLVGVEIFNLHAMFDPDKREEDLGLDPWSWIEDIGPFTEGGTSGPEPDLFFLAVLAEQTPSLAAFDALLARGPIVGTAGADAHQNVIPNELRDGERADSYRRMLRWFSNVILADDRTVDDARAALAAGRSYVAFEVLGTPDHVDFALEDGDTVVAMGGTKDGASGTLVVGCPTLSHSSPRGPDDPEIEVTVFRDGEIWNTGCGTFPVTEPGDYRVAVTMVPWHLAPFFGDLDVTSWMRTYPWIYTNAIRVR